MIVHSNALEVMFRLNGRLYGAQVPSRREFIGGAALCAAAGCVTGRDEWRPRERLRGFNLLGMFKKKIAAETPAADPKWLRSPGFFREEDFALIREWGFNFARLPLDYRIWIRGNDWKAIDGDALKPLDEAVRLGQRYGIHVQICLHRAPGYCVNPPAERADLFSSAEAFDAMATHWRHLAARYRSVPADDLSFDLLNEPCKPIPEIEATFSKLIDVIREVDADRFIIAHRRHLREIPRTSPRPQDAGTPSELMKLIEFVPPVPHPLWNLCLQMGITDAVVKVNPSLTGIADPWRHETLAKIDRMNENFFRTTFASRTWDAVPMYYSIEIEYNTPAGRADFLAVPKPGFDKPAMLIEFKYFTKKEVEKRGGGGDVWRPLFNPAT